MSNSRQSGTKHNICSGNGQSTVGGPEWIKMASSGQNGPKWTILVHFGLANAKVQFHFGPFWSSTLSDSTAAAPYLLRCAILSLVLLAETLCCFGFGAPPKQMTYNCCLTLPARAQFVTQKRLGVCTTNPKNLLRLLSRKSLQG